MKSHGAAAFALLDRSGLFSIARTQWPHSSDRDCRATSSAIEAPMVPLTSSVGSMLVIDVRANAPSLIIRHKL